MTKYVNNNGVSEMWLNIKNWVASQLLGYSQIEHTHSASDITSGLSTVATSGSYNDLSNKPTIPSKTSDLTNDSGFITSDNTKIPLAGSNQISGSLIPATDNAYNLGDSSYNFKIVYAYAVYNGVNNKSLVLSGGNNVTSGANLVLYGAGRTDGFQGNFLLTVNDGTNSYALKGHQSGMLSWSGNVIRPTTDNACNLGNSTYNFKMLYTKGITINGTQFLPSNYVPRSGGAVITGIELARTVDTSRFDIYGGRGNEHGGRIAAFGASYTDSTYAGIIGLYPYKDASNRKTMYLYPSGTWTWNGTAIQYVSDARLKQQIAEIDDKLLDAWEDVNLVQFKYNDAVNEKGKDNARLHTGYVVQQIDSACKSHNVDISQYGLYCYEEYPEETEEVEVENEDGTKTKERKVIREASEHYSLRYTEALIVECAYLRKKLKELTARIEQLESSK